jgi:acyl-CoA thioester hydrolase
MFHAEPGLLAATNETIVMNIDYTTRRSAPWPIRPPSAWRRWWSTHKGQPRTPATAGRVDGADEALLFSFSR